MNLKLLSLGRIEIWLLADIGLSKLACLRLNPVGILATLVWLTAMGCSYLSPETAPSPSQTDV
ncbi:hypothetical protein M1N23_01220, partial [Dehalococcoidia bacterium]|nr:hypothetical protein [Dehalococcoidia bacterium]